MGNLKNPIEYKFDLNTKSQPKVLCVTHTDDYKSEVLKVGVYQGNIKYDLLQTVITARMVMRWTHELLADNVACTLSQDCDILIPIDSSVIPVRAGEMLVEVNISSTEVSREQLTLQFPLIVRVNGSILGNAEVTPDSRGTIPELLEEVEQELERVQGFATEAQVFEILDNALSGNRNISPTLLVDNVVDETHNPNGDLIMYYIDSDDIRHNIFNFTPYLGTKNYNALQNRPVVTGSDVSTGVNTVLEGYMNFSSDGFTVSTHQDPDKEIDVDLAASVPNCRTASYPYERYDFNNITGTFARAGVFRIQYSMAENKPETIDDIVGSCFIIQLFSPANNANMIRYIVGLNANGQIVTYMQTAELERINAFNYAVSFQLVWKKIGEKGDKGDDGFSPTVSTTSEYLRTRVEITDVNGTHNFFVNDGESVKSAIIDANGDLKITIQGKPTSGVHPTYPERIYNVGHVVGADGFSPTATVTQTQNGATVSITDKNGTTTANISNGVNGSDYILTAQDKSDIADLVLAELPTTQGVQYGNTGN